MLMSPMESNLEFWQQAADIECVQPHVKKFIFQDFWGKRSELAFLKFIAERAGVLEKMVVVAASEHFSSLDDVEAKLIPLTSEKWASEDCQLIVFKSPVCQGGSPAWKFLIPSVLKRRYPFDLWTADAEFNSDANVLHH